MLLNLSPISTVRAMSPPDSRRAIGLRRLGGVTQQGSALAPPMRLPASLFDLESGDRALLGEFTNKQEPPPEETKEKPIILKIAKLRVCWDTQ